MRKDDHRSKQQNEYKYGNCGGRRPLPALVVDLDNCPNGHQRRFHNCLQSHGDEMLYLHDVVCRAVDKAGNREMPDL